MDDNYGVVDEDWDPTQEEYVMERRGNVPSVDTSPKDLLIESPEGPHQFHVTHSDPAYTVNIDGEDVLGHLWRDDDNGTDFFTQGGDPTTFLQLDEEGAPTEAHVTVYVAEDAGDVTGIQTFINADRTTGRGWFEAWGCWLNMELRNRKWVQTDFSPAHDIPVGKNYYVFYYDETEETWRFYENADNYAAFQDLKPIGDDSKHYVRCDGDNVPYVLCLQEASERDIATYLVAALGDEGVYIAVEPDHRKKEQYRWLAYSPDSGWRVHRSQRHTVDVDKNFQVEYDEQGKPNGSTRIYPVDEYTRKVVISGVKMIIYPQSEGDPPPRCLIPEEPEWYPLEEGTFWSVVGDEDV